MAKLIFVWAGAIVLWLTLGTVGSGLAIPTLKKHGGDVLLARGCTMFGPIMLIVGQVINPFGVDGWTLNIEKP